MKQMVWNVSPEMIAMGPIHVRWYGALFTLAFVMAFRMLRKMFAQDGFGEERVDSLLWFMIGGTVIGARLGHCLFYQPEIFLADPIRILKVWEGGLASHGAAIGIVTASYLFCRKWKGYVTLEILDRVSIGVALSGLFIRTGNFFNSEIIGKPTSLPWAVTFARVDQAPRHPAQLYEAFTYLLVFLFLNRLYWKTNARTKIGCVFGASLIGIFGARFILEFFKENQEAFEGNLPINMGQLLSIPLIAMGAWLIISSKNRPAPVRKPLKINDGTEVKSKESKAKKA
jgi:phosphatidylglycerol:prolipoprotein diacylglycerol transferase